MKLNDLLRFPNLGYSHTSIRSFSTLLCSCAIGTYVFAGESHFSIIDYMEEEQLLSVNVVTTSIGERRLYIQSDGVLSEISRFSRIGDHTLFIYLPCDDFQQDDSLHYKVGGETLKLSLNSISCKASKKIYVKKPKLIHLDKQCIIDPKGTTLWRIGSLLNEKNGYSVYQNIYAVFLMNRQNFIDDDISRLQDNLLICPSEELIASIDKKHAAEMFQDAESFRITGLSDPESTSEGIAVDSDATTIDDVMIVHSGATIGSEGGRVDSMPDELSLTLLESRDKQEKAIVANTSTESSTQVLAQLGDMELLASQRGLDTAITSQVDESIVANIDTATIVGTLHTELVGNKLEFSQTEDSEKRDGFVIGDNHVEGVEKEAISLSNEPGEAVTDKPAFSLAEKSDRRDEMIMTTITTELAVKKSISAGNLVDETGVPINHLSPHNPKGESQIDEALVAGLSLATEQDATRAELDADARKSSEAEVIYKPDDVEIATANTGVTVKESILLDAVSDESELLISHASIDEPVTDAPVFSMATHSDQQGENVISHVFPETIIKAPTLVEEQSDEILIITNGKNTPLSENNDGVLPNCSIEPNRKTLWRVSVTLGQLNGFSIYQNLYALYAINPDAFPTRDINHMINMRLHCPTIKKVSQHTSNEAKKLLKMNVDG